MKRKLNLALPGELTQDEARTPTHALAEARSHWLSRLARLRRLSPPR